MAEQRVIAGISERAYLWHTHATAVTRQAVASQQRTVETERRQRAGCVYSP